MTGAGRPVHCTAYDESNLAVGRSEIDRGAGDERNIVVATHRDVAANCHRTFGLVANKRRIALDEHIERLSRGERVNQRGTHRGSIGTNASDNQQRNYRQ